MSTRRQARQAALQILYRYDVSDASTGMAAPLGGELAAEISRHFDHFDIGSPGREFAAELVAGTLRDRLELDALIEKYAAHWKIARMGFVDRNLLRMAAFELIHFVDVPPKVTLDEAIELAKQFGTQESPSFINGILDAIRAEKAAHRS